METLNIAIPKGRLIERIFSVFERSGIEVPKHKRSLILTSPTHNINLLLVKNTDLTAYVANGIASLGIVGSDLLTESEDFFYTLASFDFGETRICLIAQEESPPIEDMPQTIIATKYQRFTKQFIAKRGIKAKVIPLSGSVELAPLLGLAPYIVDLVETGQTIKENGLIIQEVLGTTNVQLIANPALYKYYHKEVAQFLRTLKL